MLAQLSGLGAGGSYAATGLGAVSSLAQGFTAADNITAQADATAQMDEFKARQLANQAEIGRAQAAQTDAFMRTKLMSTMSMMSAISAAQGTSSNSPSTSAILARTQAQGDQQRMVQVGNYYDQARESQIESGMYTAAAQQTLDAASDAASNSIFNGILGGATKLAAGLAGLS